MNCRRRISGVIARFCGRMLHNIQAKNESRGFPCRIKLHAQMLHREKMQNVVRMKFFRMRAVPGSRAEKIFCHAFA